MLRIHLTSRIPSTIKRYDCDKLLDKVVNIFINMKHYSILLRKRKSNNQKSRYSCPFSKHFMHFSFIAETENNTVIVNAARPLCSYSICIEITRAVMGIMNRLERILG